MTADLNYIAAKTENFSEPDHFDAAAAFQFLTVRAFRQHGELSQQCHGMRFMEGYHSSRVSTDLMDQEKRSLRITTSIDISNYGESRLYHPLRE